MHFSDVVKRVIELAAAINGYWETELPKRHPRYPLVDPKVGDPPPPPEEEELRQFLRSRPADEVYKVLALAHAGRYLSATAFLRHSGPGTGGTVDVREVIDELAEMPGLDEYLEDGIRELAASGIRLDPVEAMPTPSPN